MSRRIFLAAVFLFGVGVLGCSNARPTAEMKEVSGRVTLNGQPVKKTIMKLTPDTPGAGREDECIVENGEYRVKLIAARYKVSFIQILGGSHIPARYQSPDTSQFVLDGTKSEPANFDLN